MSIDELCALPVETLAEKDCLLFLWATFPQLPEALRLIRAWGFTFKTVAFVWLKQNRKTTPCTRPWHRGFLKYNQKRLTAPSLTNSAVNLFDLKGNVELAILRSALFLFIV